MGKKRSDKSRCAAGAVAGAAAIAIVLAGIFAHINSDQHKTNSMMSGQNVSLTLNDGFKPPAAWTLHDPVNTDVSVTNSGASDAPVFVRIQFKEYMEFVPQTLITDPESPDGAPFLFATYASGDKIGQYMLWADKPDSYNYIMYDVGSTDYCLAQNSELKDGIYGKPMYEAGALDVFGTATKADYPVQPDSVQDPSNPECNYNVTEWRGKDRLSGIKDDGGKGASDIADYISWTLGADVISMSDWVAGGFQTGHFWVIDDTDGWVYWGNPLAPGQTTANALDSVTLASLPDDVTNLEYYVHTDMESCTGDEFANGQWSDASKDAQDLVYVLLGVKNIPSTLNISDATYLASGNTLTVTPGL